MDILSNLTNLLGSAAGPQQSQGGMGGLGALMGMLGGGGGGMGQNSGAAFGGGGGDALGGLGGLVGALLGGGGRSGGASPLAGIAGMLGGGASSGGGLGGLGSLIGTLMGGQGAGLLGSLLGGEQAPPAPHAGMGNPEEARAVNTLRTLVYAARADGRLDDREKQSITGEVQRAGLSPEGQRMVGEFLSENVDAANIARNITSPEEALQIYALSCAITRIDSPLERRYLDDLAQSLRIPARTKNAIEQRITQ